MASKMNSRAERLAQYCQDRLGHSLRVVGFHTPDEYEIVFMRDDLVSRYSAENIDQFISTSQTISTGLRSHGKGMGSPEASLHILEDGLVIQFHHSKENVVFVTMDQGVGRHFLQFVSDCQDQMS